MWFFGSTSAKNQPCVLVKCILWWLMITARSCSVDSYVCAVSAEAGVLQWLQWMHFNTLKEMQDTFNAVRNCLQNISQDISQIVKDIVHLQWFSSFDRLCLVDFFAKPFTPLCCQYFAGHCRKVLSDWCIIILYFLFLNPVFLYVVFQLHLFYFYSAAALLAIQSAVIPTAISSVCLSVCHAGTLSRRMKIESRGLYSEVAKTL